MEGASSRRSTAVDHAALFAAIPTAYLVMDRDLVILDANASYLDAVGRTLEEIVGREVLEAFPSDPESEHQVRSSFERARDTGRVDPMPILEYAIASPEGGLEQRFWSLISVPVLDEDGECVLLAQRVEDVTEYVRVRERGRSAQEQGEAYQRRFEQAETDLYARAVELRAAVEAGELAGRRLAALSEVALALTSAESVEELTATVLAVGIPAVGATGGAVAVAVEGAAEVVELELSTADGYARGGGVLADRLPLDGPLPPSVAARGTLVLVPDHAAAASVPGLSAASSLTGTVAWAALPLRVGDRLLGSLTVAWAQPQVFTREEVELLSAFAAQCAQALDRVQVRAAERAAAQRSQRMSEALQRSLLTPPPASDDVTIAVRYQPAAQLALVGGDWYDAFIAPDGSTSIVIGDVAGHDRDAAAAMGQLRNVLRGVSQTLGEPPASVLTVLDGAVARLELDVLATVLVASVARRTALVTGRRRGWALTWSSAGHPPPLLVRADGSAELLVGEADLLIGLDPSTKRHDTSVRLGAGDTVVLFTDGLVERRGESLDAGLERLRAAAHGLAPRHPEQWCDALLESFGQDLDDDVALLVVQVGDVPAPPAAGLAEVDGAGAEG